MTGCVLGDLYESITGIDVWTNLFSFYQQGQEIHEVTNWHFKTWPDKSVPHQVSPLTEFVKKVASAQQTVAGHLLVHCRLKILLFPSRGNFILSYYRIVRNEPDSHVTRNCFSVTCLLLIGILHKSQTEVCWTLRDGDIQRKIKTIRDKITSWKLYLLQEENYSYLPNK